MTASIIKPEFEVLIFTIRGMKIMVDADLALLYDIQTKRLKEQVKRNIRRFPEDFMFELSIAEKNELVANCDRLVSLKHSSVNPLVFTEQGISMLSSVLHSEKAIQIDIEIMHAFSRYRAFLKENEEMRTQILKLNAKLSQTFQFLLNKIDALHQKADKSRKIVGYITNKEKYA